MKQKTYILLAIISCLLLASCENDDDVTEIFVGNRFKITGITYNGTKVIKDVDQFYESDNIYYITFNAITFQGVLQAGTSIEGSWKADGNGRSFNMIFNSSSNLTGANTMCDMVYNVLKNATSYSGDKNVIKIIKDNNSYIELSSM